MKRKSKEGSSYQIPVVCIKYKQLFALAQQFIELTIHELA